VDNKRGLEKEKDRELNLSRARPEARESKGVGGMQRLEKEK